MITSKHIRSFFVSIVPHLPRYAIGWIFIYAAMTKIVDPAWSAAGYIGNASTASGFYHALLSPNVLPVINFINEWGMLLLGISLLSGIAVRASAIFGSVLMFLYYLPVLTFPTVGHYLLIDEHIVFILILLPYAILGSKGPLAFIEKKTAKK